MNLILNRKRAGEEEMYFAWWHGGEPRLCCYGVSRDCVSMSRVLFSLKGKESCYCTRA